MDAYGCKKIIIDKFTNCKQNTMYMTVYNPQKLGLAVRVLTIGIIFQEKNEKMFKIENII